MFQFCARACGLKSNEHADRLANLVVVQGGIEMDCTDIPNVLRDNWKVSDAANDSESITMIRLHELHIKTGTDRHQQYAERQRRIVNQHNTVTIGCYTLTDMLNEKFKHFVRCVMRMR
jgi:hypothetical protein